MSNVTIYPLEELEKQIRLSRIALAEARRVEELDGFNDALLSMERTYCEGILEGFEYAYLLMAGKHYVA